MRAWSGKGRLLRGLLIAVLLPILLSGCGTHYAVVQNKHGEDLMLLGHDPVAYFTQSRPLRGNPAIKANFREVTYYFASEEHKRMFLAEPAKYEPQYGGFCASGAAYGVKLGSDPHAWEVYQGRLFIFGDVVGQEFWKLEPDWNIEKADAMWPAAGAWGHRIQSIKRVIFRVPWHKKNGELMAAWQAKHPGKAIVYDPGRWWDNYFLKYPGWRAREGWDQPALGVPGEWDDDPGVYPQRPDRRAAVPKPG